jgi:phosphoribosylaminoimidazole (AIR) synthetase
LALVVPAEEVQDVLSALSGVKYAVNQIGKVVSGEKKVTLTQ